MSIGREHPVVIHIEDAESWLARAKTNYRAANETRGELDLSLAQAEIRYAWELSRKKAKGAGVAHPGRRPSPFRRWLPLAAAFIVVFSLLVWIRPWKLMPQGETPLARVHPPAPGGETAVEAVANRPSPTPAAPMSVPGPRKEGSEWKEAAPGGILAGKIDVSAPQPDAGSSGQPLEAASPVEAEKEEGDEPPESPSGDPSPVPSPAEPPVPIREEPPPLAADLKPAAQLGFELGELERVAKETLIEDHAIYRNH